MSRMSCRTQQVTPIDAEHTHIRWQMYHPPGISDGKMRVTTARIRDLVKQINQDIPIWNTKSATSTDPILVKGDGPMLAYRRAYQRFYDSRNGGGKGMNGSDQSGTYTVPGKA